MKITVLPDGSTLKSGEVIYRMQRPLHGQTLSVKPGPGQTMEDKAAKGLAFKAINLVKSEGMTPQDAYQRVMGGFKTLSIASEKRALQFAISDGEDLLTQSHPLRKKPMAEATDMTDIYSELTPDAHADGEKYCSPASIARANPDVSYSDVSTALRSKKMKGLRTATIRGQVMVHAADAAKAVSLIKSK